jgi:hypothetical protein
MREGMSEVPESEGGSTSAGDIEAILLSKKSARLKMPGRICGHWNTAPPSDLLVDIAHLLFISAKWSKLNSVRKVDVLPLQPDAVPDRRSRAASTNDPSATSPCAGVVSLTEDRIVRGIAVRRAEFHDFKN